MQDFFQDMGIAGLEPATKRLWVFCSNQLSYMPRSNLSNSLIPWSKIMVGDIGLEPMTPCL